MDPNDDQTGQNSGMPQDNGDGGQPLTPPAPEPTPTPAPEAPVGGMEEVPPPPPAVGDNQGNSMPTPGGEEHPQQ